MIAFLSGTVHDLRENSVVLLVSGVGYELLCPASTLGRLVSASPAELHTRLVVREDSMTLYGFLDTDSLRLFDLLTGVSGVGPKLALALLSAMSPSALAQGLLGGDTALLSSVSGVGKRTAERLVLELQNKVPEHLAAGTKASGTAAVASTAGRDAIDALLALGFRDTQVRSAVSELLSQDSTLSADALIRRALGKLR